MQLQQELAALEQQAEAQQRQLVELWQLAEPSMEAFKQFHDLSEQLLQVQQAALNLQSQWKRVGGRGGSGLEAEGPASGGAAGLGGAHVTPPGNTG